MSKLLKKYFQHKQRIYLLYIYNSNRGRQGHDRMVIVFTTTYAIRACNNSCCEFESRSGRGIQHYVIKFVSDLRQVGGFLWVLQLRIPLLTSVIRHQYCTWHFYYLYFQRHISWFFFVSNDLRCDVIVRFVDKVGFMVFSATFNNISVISWRI